jgi:hypothetical protein
MTENNDIGFDAWRGKVVGGGDANPFRVQESGKGNIPVNEVREPASVTGPIESDKSNLESLGEMRDSARIAVMHGVFPGIIFDTQSMNEAIGKGYNLEHSQTGQKDKKGIPILEIIVKSPHGDKVVGFASTEETDEYISVKPAEIN